MADRKQPKKMKINKKKEIQIFVETKVCMEIAESVSRNADDPTSATRKNKRIMD